MLKRVIHNVVCMWSRLSSVEGLGIDVRYYLDNFLSPDPYIVQIVHITLLTSSHSRRVHGAQGGRMEGFLQSGVQSYGEGGGGVLP